MFALFRLRMWLVRTEGVEGCRVRMREEPEGKLSRRVVEDMIVIIREWEGTVEKKCEYDRE